jgi:hypothetical protein
MREPKTNAEIVALAQQMLVVMAQLDQSPQHDEALRHRVESQVDQLDPGFERALLLMATKLLEGTPYIVNTDNPENARRACSLAEHMGASISKNQNDPWADVFSEPRHNLRFDPPELRGEVAS